MAKGGTDVIAIKNANVVLENEILADGIILIENNKIFNIGKKDTIDIPKDATIIDAKGLYVGPGFVDIHVHGGGEAQFYQDPEKAAAHFLSHGETTVFATLYYNLNKKDFLDAIDRIKEAIKNGTAKNIKGFYMEGPYMNPKYGASASKNEWKDEIKPEDYIELIQKAGNLAYVWAVAPERDGIEPFMKYAKDINPEATFAVGHSEATPDEIEKLKHYGIKIETHCMNATNSKTDWSGTKGAGPDEACLLDDDIYAELICDSEGIHVNPYLQKLILKIKGIDKVILISDSFFNNEPTPENVKHITDLSFDENGNLSGSKLTLDKACRNIVKHTNCTIKDAFLMASTNPARSLGLDNEIGSLKEGKKANIVFTDDKFNIYKVMLEGKIIKEEI